MRRAALIHVLVVLIALVPVVRVTCDVICIRTPAPPPSCHHSTPPNDTRDRCSHDHDAHFARLVDTAPFVAVMPAGPIFGLRIVFSDLDADAPRALVSRGSPIIVLRV